MKDKVLYGLGYIFSVILGFFTIIFLAIPYLSLFEKTVDNNALVPVVTNYFSYDISGYKTMDLWQLGFSGVMTSLLQIFILILSLLLIVWGVCGCLKIFGLFNKFPNKIGKVKSKTVTNILFYIYLALSVLLLIFLIVVSATNQSSDDYYGKTLTIGLKLSAGVFLTLILVLAFLVTTLIISKKHPINEETVFDVYVCSGCGRNANPHHKFCYKCGEKIIKKTDDVLDKIETVEEDQVVDVKVSNEENIKDEEESFPKKKKKRKLF